MASSKVTKDGVISNLRACLLSAKGGVSIDSLNGDYRMLVGENIPFHKLGHSTLEDFLKTVPLIRLSRRGRDWVVEAAPTEGTAHISRMVARQKTAPKKPPKKGSYNYRRPMLSSSSWKPPTPMSELYSRNTRVNIENQYYEPQRPRTNNASPMMIGLQAISSVPSYEKPRYLLPYAVTTPTSPRKRFQDRKPNALLQTPVNQSTSQTSNGNITRSIEQAVKTSNTTNQGAAAAPRPLMQQHVEIPRLDRLVTYNPFPIQMQPNPMQTQPKTRESLCERLVIKPKPLMNTVFPSPAQLLADAQNLQTPPATPTSPVPMMNQLNLPFSKQGQDPCTQLRALALELNLPEPVYKVVTRQPKRQATVYVCEVKVGSISVTSYPHEKPTREEAEQLAAEEAMKELQEKYGHISGLSKTTNRNLIRKRVTAIVTQHKNGVFMKEIPAYYKNEFNENLPEDWLKVVEECSSIVRDKGANNSTILRAYVPQSDRVEETISPKMDNVTKLNPIGPTVPGFVDLPTDEYWSMFITSITSTVDIWARIVGENYSEKLEAMATEMESHYSKALNSLGTGTIEIGDYYAVAQDDSWHRVQCVDYDVSTGQAVVLFIDHGDDDFVNKDELFTLDKKFCKLPAQAIRLCLAGLEEYGDIDAIVNDLDETLLGRTLYAQVLSREMDEDGPFATVVLYDTSGSEDINLNEILSNVILTRLAVPKLDEEGQVLEVYVSHVAENGDVFLQVKSISIECLVNLLNQLMRTRLSKELVKKSAVTTIDTSKVYLARCCEDNSSYRTIVTGIGKNNQLNMYLVDYGRTIVVGKENLLQLDTLSEVLAEYPHQALKVRLHNIPETMFNHDMKLRLAELAPPSEALLVKVVTPAGDGVPPSVEVFKRIQPNNVLASINNTLILDSAPRKFNGDGNNNTRPRKRVERAISRHGVIGDGESVPQYLKPPHIPEFGNFFDVHVTMAANPGNFTVQPYLNTVSLQTMMVQLQETCINFTGSHPTLESVREGKLYAAKHNDGSWYRVSILNIINDQMVTVYFCDYGDVSALTFDRLQPLGKQFLELPYQAIRARLVGIQPCNIDWSVEDCLRFQEMVVDKNFVSTVVESGPDRLSPADTVLGLKLTDVSKSSDIYIDRVLVEEGRAKFVDDVPKV